MKAKKNSKVKLEFIKYNALKLRANYQLPYKLAYYINLLDSTSSIDIIGYLKDATEQYLRVGGYYKRHPEEDRLYSTQIEQEYLKLVHR